MEDSEEAATRQVLEGMARMTSERVEKLTKSRKYLKVASAFPNYNVRQAFTRGANDIILVSLSS